MLIIFSFLKELDFFLLQILNTTPCKFFLFPISTEEPLSVKGHLCSPADTPSVIYEHLIPSPIEILGSREEVEKCRYAYCFGTDLV